VSPIKNPQRYVQIGIVGKYTELPDAYKSLNEALLHGGIANNAKVELVYISAEEIEGGNWPREVFEVDALLVPIGFGQRGTEGKIRAIRYAREHGVPFFGICLGMQCLVIEYARNVCGIAEASSSEFNAETQHAVIYKLRDLLGVEELGGTMRLGAYPCRLTPGTLAHEVYAEDEISERHRHRYEVNQKYLQELTDSGLVVAGMSPDGRSRPPLIHFSSPTSRLPWKSRLGARIPNECKRAPWSPSTKELHERTRDGAPSRDRNRSWTAAGGRRPMCDRK
jgi:CTP synthase